MAVLCIEKGKQRGLRFELCDDAAPTVIGRDAAADVVLDDERASRQHARIQRRRGAWVIEDLGSRNGILLRGQSVRNAEIRDGELFQVGSTLLRLKEDERIDPFSGMEIQGARLVRLLADEAGVLSYQAQQLAMDRPVRVDVVHPRRRLPAVPEAGGRPAPGDLRRLLGEARAAALQVDHPQVLRALRAELPDAAGGGFVVLRWSDAPTLEAIAGDYAALPLALRIAHYRKLAEAVLARSVPPLLYPIGLRHIRIHPEEGPHVAALELSALLAHQRGQAADLPAFPDYLAPEDTRPPDRAWAGVVYNLGALGYRLLTGIPPMGEGAVEEILARHRDLPPAPPSLAAPEIPADLSRLLERMLAKDPAARPGTAEEVLEAIPHPAGTQPAVAKPPREAPAARPARPAARPAVREPGPPPRPEKPAPSPAARGPGRPVRPAPPAAARGVPLAFQLILWPALWAGLLFGGRYLMWAVLEALQRR